MFGYEWQRQRRHLTSTLNRENHLRIYFDGNFSLIFHMKFTFLIEFWLNLLKNKNILTLKCQAKCTCQNFDSG